MVLHTDLGVQICETWNQEVWEWDARVWDMRDARVRLCIGHSLRGLYIFMVENYGFWRDDVMNYTSPISQTFKTDALERFLWFTELTWWSIDRLYNCVLDL